MAKEVHRSREERISYVDSVIEEHKIIGVRGEDFSFPNREYGAYCTVMMFLVKNMVEETRRKKKEKDRSLVKDGIVTLYIPDEFQFLVSSHQEKIRIPLIGLEQWKRRSMEFLRERGFSADYSVELDE